MATLSMDDRVEREKARKLGIDVSQWIEPSAIADYVKTKLFHRQPPHPLDLLFQRDIISKRHHSAGEVLIRLRNCALMRLDVATMGQVLRDKGQNATDSKGLIDGDYIYILDYRLARDQRDIIETVCWNPKAFSEAWLRENHSGIFPAFDNLAAILQELTQQQNG